MHWRCDRLRNDSISHLAANSLKLTKLSFAGYGDLTGTQSNSLVNQSTHCGYCCINFWIFELNLNVWKFRVLWQVFVSEFAPQPTTLIICTHPITDETIRTIVSKLTWLTHLSVSECEKLSSESISLVSWLFLNLLSRCSTEINKCFHIELQLIRTECEIFVHKPHTDHQPTDITVSDTTRITGHQRFAEHNGFICSPLSAVLHLTHLL